MEEVVLRKEVALSWAVITWAVYDIPLPRFAMLLLVRQRTLRSCVQSTSGS